MRVVLGTTVGSLKPESLKSLKLEVWARPVNASLAAGAAYSADYDRISWVKVLRRGMYVRQANLQYQSDATSLFVIDRLSFRAREEGSEK